MMHQRTMFAIIIGTCGGYIGGTLEPELVGLAVAFGAGVVAIGLTPHADKVATDWIGPLSEGDEGSVR